MYVAECVLCDSVFWGGWCTLPNVCTLLLCSPWQLQDHKDACSASLPISPLIRDCSPKVPSPPRLRNLAIDDFVVDLTHCKPPGDDVYRKGLVDIAPCVRACFQQVQIWLPQKTAGQRVPPAMLSRCMRGGKTTLLYRIFRVLRKTGFNPIFVSFSGGNSDQTIRQLERERDSIETLTRGIAVAVMKTKPADVTTVQCSREVLQDYLDKMSNVVLLIDELNVLLKPGCADQHKSVGEFVRAQFLDRKGRFFVFSTHFAVTAGIQELLGIGVGSVRDAIPIRMPKSFSLDKLRSMHPDCQSLTGCQVAFYSGIPSLIYTVMTNPSFDFEARFRDIPKPPVDSNLIESFLEEFFTGARRDERSPLRLFDSLTEYSNSSAEGPRLRWVLGYAGLMCNWIAKFCIDDYKVFQAVARKISELKVDQQRIGSGKDWEDITQIAILMRCLHAKYTHQPHALLGLDGPDLNPRTCPTIYVQEFLGKTIFDATQKWEERSRTAKYPHVAVIIPTHNSFNKFDSVLIHRQSATDMWVICSAH